MQLKRAMNYDYAATMQWQSVWCAELPHVHAGATPIVMLRAVAFVALLATTAAIIDKKVALQDVIVIGAGMSGATAARTLTNAGARVVVLEARQRAGGRMHSIQTRAGRIDMGAMWVRIDGCYLNELHPPCSDCRKHTRS